MAPKFAHLATIWLLIVFCDQCRSSGDPLECDEEISSATSSGPRSPSRVSVRGQSASSPRLVTDYWSSATRLNAPIEAQALQDQFGQVKARSPDNSQEEEFLPLPRNLRDIIDFSVKPCDNFEAFTTVRGEYADNWSILDDIDDQLNALITLDDNSPPSTSQDTSSTSQPASTSKRLRNIRALYQSCRKRESSFDENKWHFFKLMTELGSAPLLQWELGWDPSQGDAGFRFVVSMLRLYRMGLMEKQPIGLDTRPDPDDPSRLLVHIDQPEDQMMLVETSLLFSYNKFKSLDLAVNQLVSFEEIEEVYRFVKALRDVRGKENKRPKKMRLNEFAKKYPGIDWRHLVRDLTGKQDDDQEILISNEDYLSLLEKLINVSSTKLIPNYLFLNMIERLGGFVEKSLGEGAGHVDCLRLVRDQMDLPLMVELKRIGQGTSLELTPEKLAKLNQLIEAIRLQVELNLKRASWMSLKSKELALDKLKRMKFFIALSSPDEINYDEALASDIFGLDEIELGANKPFIENLLKIRARIASFELAELRQPSREPAVWMNLNYNPSLEVALIDEANVIDIPYGLLQAPFFDLSQPDYMNYGSIGFLVARTVLKAFDMHGFRFNAAGQRSNIWDKKTYHENMNKRLEFLRSTRDQPEDAAKTLSHNLVNLGASHLIYQAYESNVLKSSPNYHPLDLSCKVESQGGIVLSPGQLLLICLAQNISICREEDTHYKDFPCIDRVNQTFMHLPQFNDQFKCAVGSNMRPDNFHQVDIWSSQR